MSPRIVATCVFLVMAAACGTPGPYPPDDSAPAPLTGPVDGPYMVVVSDLVSTGLGRLDQDGQLVEVDVRLRPDGLIDLHSLEAPFPESIRSLNGIAVVDNEVDFVGQYHEYDQSTNPTYPYTIKGYVRPDSLDLRVEFIGYAGRRLSYRLSGQPRPLSSATEADGFYLLMNHDHGRVCPGDPLSAEPRSSWPTLANVRDYRDGQLRLLIDEQLRFEIAKPDSQGQINEQGSSAQLRTDRMWEYTGLGITGQFGPTRVDCRMDLGWPDPEAGICAQAVRIEGRKIIPSLSAPEGVYFGHYLLEDSCREGSTIDGMEFDDQLVVLPYPDGSRLIVDEATDVVGLGRQADGHWSFREEGDVYVLTMDLRIGPDGRADYQHVLRADRDGDGIMDCAIGVTAQVAKRFVFPDKVWP